MKRAVTFRIECEVDEKSPNPDFAFENAVRNSVRAIVDAFENGKGVAPTGIKRNSTKVSVVDVIGTWI